MQMTEEYRQCVIAVSRGLGERAVLGTSEGLNAITKFLLASEELVYSI